MASVSHRNDVYRSTFDFSRDLNLSFEWKIGNFSKLEFYCPKKSPEFTLIKDYSWYLELERTSRYVVLLKLCNTRSIKIGVKFTITVSQNRGRAFYSQTDLIKDFESIKKVDLISNIKLPVSLRNDLLLFTCSMKFHHLNAEKKLKFEKSLPEFHTLRNLSLDLKTIFHESRNTDVSFHIGDDVIKAHRIILRARSHVFEKMFDYDTNETATGNIYITDIKASTMKKLLDYLYTGTYEKGNFLDTCDLYYAADKYEILELRSSCKYNLMDYLEVDTVCSLLMLANRHGDKQFEEHLMGFIGENFKSLVETESWEQLIDQDTKLAGMVIRFCARVMSN